MKYTACIIMLLSALALPALGRTGPVNWNAVDVRVISDYGSEYPKYRTRPRACAPGVYYYMEAVKGEKYSIEIANRSNSRIGVVIAVDGRNIISGGKSYLNNSERMYVIGPYETNTFEGWRTGMDRTNRFYFTQQSNSYAEKVFADASAMGTIAVAVYREKIRRPAPLTPHLDDSLSRSNGAGEKSRSAKAEREEQAGTGFGETTYSPAREVLFEPEDGVAEKIVLKYEWRSELCRKGIIGCVPGNRFWPVSDGFAPVPRDFRE
jgi:hypothetical protein